jgi:hypothetical protein
MSLSKSPNRAFYRALGLVIAGLSIGILILALLVSTSGPRVRDVVVQNSSGNGISSVDQGLNVVFDRPISATDDYASAVEISPETDYTVSHRNQQLSVSFNQNLLSNTEYVLTVKPVLEDDLGNQMAGEYTYKFATAEPSFTYLERNYEPGAVDKVIQRAPLSQKSDILFGARRIKSFARNDSYLAAVTQRADHTDELRAVDLRTREESSVGIPHDVQVDNLSFSPVNNQFVFITRVVPNAGVDESYLKDYTDKLYRYDIDAEQLQPVETLSDQGNILSALYSQDGQALLYLTLDGEYYLTGATQATEPTLLGKYGESGGFDRTNTKLSFLSGSGVAIYDAQAKEWREVPNIHVGGRISTPTFLHNGDGLLYLKDPLEAKGDTVQVYTTNTEGKVEGQAVDLPQATRFFGDPVVSYDDRYVLIEATFGPQGDDDYVGNSKPKDARLVLYDRFDNKVLDSGTTRGVDPVWHR